MACSGTLNSLKSIVSRCGTFAEYKRGTGRDAERIVGSSDAFMFCQLRLDYRKCFASEADTSSSWDWSWINDQLRAFRKSKEIL
jgi:hypothetical protein